MGKQYKDDQSIPPTIGELAAVVVENAFKAYRERQKSKEMRKGKLSDV